MYASDTLAIASGQNAVANLLDMLVLTSMTRAAVETYWLPKVYGESARPMLEACRDAEAKVSRLAAPLLKPAQQDELRQAIQTDYARQPDPQSVSHVRALALATQLGKTAGTASPEHATSVFSLLQLDPLAGLDPAAREIAQTRLFAERALYVAQRMPLLVRWQTELLSYQLAATPEAGQVLTNLDRFGHSADALARTADEFPKLVNAQREAAIKQLFDGVATERTNLLASLADEDVKLRATLVELRQTLDAGTELVKSSDATLKALDTVMSRFDKGTNAPVVTTTNARPFDILDYAATAKEATLAIKELNATINSFDKAVPQIQQAGEMFESAGQRLLHRLFVVGAGLIVLLWLGAVVAALAYRRLSSKVSTAPSLVRK